MFSKLLLAYDGSETARHALDKAIRMKTMLEHSKLEVVHVAQLTNVVVGDAFITGTNAVQNHLYDAAEAVVEEARQRLSYLHSATVTMLEGGAPAKVILNYADTHQFDLIIVGSRGLGTFKELLLGSVSYDIVQHAKIPVLVVK